MVESSPKRVYGGGGSAGDPVGDSDEPVFRHGIFLELFFAITAMLWKLNPKWRFPKDEAIEQSVNEMDDAKAHSALRKPPNPYIENKVAMVSPEKLPVVWKEMGFEGTPPLPPDLIKVLLIWFRVQVTWEKLGVTAEEERMVTKDKKYVFPVIRIHKPRGVSMSVDMNAVRFENDSVRVRISDHTMVQVADRPTVFTSVKDESIDILVRPFEVAIEDPEKTYMDRFVGGKTRDGKLEISDVVIQGKLALDQEGVSAEGRAGVFVMSESVRAPPDREICLFNRDTGAQHVSLVVDVKRGDTFEPVVDATVAFH